MTELTIDEFIEQNSSEPIAEAGVYDVFVSSISEASTQSGARVILVTFKTAQGQVHYERFFLSEKAKYRLVWCIRSLQIPKNDIKINWQDFDAVLSHLQNYIIDRWCRVTITVGSYNNQPQYQISKFEPMPVDAMRYIPESDVQTNDEVPF